MKTFIFDYTIKVSKYHIIRNVLDIEADDQVQAIVDARRHVEGQLRQLGLPASTLEIFVLLGSRPA